MTQAEWLRLGYENGWCGPALCAVHDGEPISLEEEEEYEEHGELNCYHVVRVYEDAEMKQAVETNHSPSVWRANGI